MSTGKRAYDILRGYVGSEWDRIKDVERELAGHELSMPATPPPSASARKEPEKTEPLPVVDRRAYACRLLGVSQGCSYDVLRKAFARLNKRSDPANFPEGSDEAAKAAEIQRKVNWAYGVLTEGMDATERRFRSLELE